MYKKHLTLVRSGGEMPIPAFIFSMVPFSTKIDDKRLVTWLHRIECKVSKKGKCIFRFWHLAKIESS